MIRDRLLHDLGAKRWVSTKCLGTINVGEAIMEDSVKLIAPIGVYEVLDGGAASGVVMASSEWLPQMGWIGKRFMPMTNDTTEAWRTGGREGMEMVVRVLGEGDGDGEERRRSG